MHETSLIFEDLQRVVKTFGDDAGRLKPEHVPQKRV
jgi:hypothetical protein